MRSQVFLIVRTISSIFLNIRYYNHFNKLKWYYAKYLNISKHS